MQQPHVHAELIKLWAEGAIIQRKRSCGRWETVARPTWKPQDTFRVKPIVLVPGKFYAVIWSGEEIVIKAISKNFLEIYGAFPVSLDDVVIMSEPMEIPFSK